MRTIELKHANGSISVVMPTTSDIRHLMIGDSVGERYLANKRGISEEILHVDSVKVSVIRKAIRAGGQRFDYQKTKHRILLLMKSIVPLECPTTSNLTK